MKYDDSVMLVIEFTQLLMVTIIFYGVIKIRKLDSFLAGRGTKLKKKQLSRT